VDWVNALRAEAPVRDDALSRLHALLLRVARAEAWRRRGTLAPQTIVELDDLCMQAADDALAAITRKLDGFKGLSRFTTWAAKFVILEISSRMRRSAWRNRRIEWSDAAWNSLQSPARAADRALEDREQLELLRRAMSRDLTERQRMILTAAVVEEVPVDVLAERLGASRGAIYKILHDARRKLRQALAECNSGVLP
jgi:RNA polymerase sigma-70 factor (ECF subfamily)